MTAPRKETFTQDEFLKQPFLFRYGPPMMWVVGLLMVVAFYWVAHWRIEEGRRGIYEGALRAAQAAAETTRRDADRLFERLRQTTRTIETLAENGNDARAIMRLAEGLDLPGAGIEVLALSATNEPLASTSPALTRSSGADSLAQALPGNDGDEALQVLKALTLGPRTLLPVVQRLHARGDVRRMVYLLDANVLLEIAQKTLGTHRGWLRIVNQQGLALLDTLPVEDVRTGTVANVDAAMALPLRWTSRRFLVADATSTAAGLGISVGLREDEALAAFRERVDASWGIAIIVSVFVLAMIGIVSVALRKFSVKERYLRRLATTDILTELPNRRSFHALLARAVERANQRARPLGLLFIDLDNFKYVNDTLGHDAGDHLLHEVARILENTVGSSGQVCRLGGDEFTILLPDASSSARALAMGKRITRALCAPLDIEGLKVQPRASVGAALLPTHAKTAADLMRVADVALYQAKCNGKGCAVVYDQAMAAREIAREILTRELALAVENEGLFLVYQPKFRLANGALSGFEALVRWHHPHRGTVRPGEFIELAEKSGLISELGNWVLTRAVRQMREWHEQGFGWQHVAVNVSPLQLRDDDFADYVQSVLARFEVPGRCLQLELTEGSLAADTKKARALVRRLRSLEVAVAIDDFGTGYSSLGALCEFDLDCLKIDRSFVAALHTAKGQEVCRAAINFGQALGLRVIAEGVETREQGEWLASAQCDEVQGFRYAHPLPAPEAIAAALARSSTAPVAPLETPGVLSPELSLSPDACQERDKPACSPQACSVSFNLHPESDTQRTGRNEATST